MNLGRIAYESYSAHQGCKSHDGAPIPSWDDNHRADIKIAWGKAAGDVADAVAEEFATTVRKLLDAGEPHRDAVDTALDIIQQKYQTPKGRRPAISHTSDRG